MRCSIFFNAKNRAGGLLWNDPPSVCFSKNPLPWAPDTPLNFSAVVSNTLKSVLFCLLFQDHGHHILYLIYCMRYIDFSWSKELKKKNCQGRTMEDGNFFLHFFIIRDRTFIHKFKFFHVQKSNKPLLSG